MQKVLVISDSHGDGDIIKKIQEIEKPFLSLHLGDFARDLGEGLAVRGNCDAFSQEPLERMVELQGIKIYMVHGHVEGVKQSLERLFYKAKERGADIALFGHTHRAFGAQAEGVFLLNPGSLSHPAPGEERSYLVLEIDQGKFIPRFEKV